MPSPSCLAELFLNIDLSGYGLDGYNLDDYDDQIINIDKDICGALDSLLNGKRFPFLRRVLLHETIPHEFFPKLHKAQLLKVHTAPEEYVMITID